MYKSKVLIGFVSLFYILFVVFQFSGYDVMAFYFRALILPLIGLTYFLYVKDKTLLFSLFLIFYSISDLMALFVGYIPYNVDYYIGNLLYILAYCMLFLEICKSVSVLHIIRNFKIHVVVLTALNIYIVYVLQVIVDPYVAMTNEYFVELSYNIVMLVLLSASLLNYFYKDNKKSLYLFIGALCIVFSEVISVAYLYIAQKSLLNFLSTTLAVLAFYFFYQQSKLENEKSVKMIIE